MNTKWNLKAISVMVMLGLAVVLSGCSNSSVGTATETGDQVKTTTSASSSGTSKQLQSITPEGAILLYSSAGYDTSPPTDNVPTLVEGNNAFALDLYRVLVNESGKEGMNRFFSPYSISSCFAMVYGGARSNTETQMKNVFQFNLDQDQLHPAFNALSLDLTARGEQDLDEDGEADFQLDIANAMWGQKDYTFLTSYLDLLEENYGAGIRILDMRNEPEISANKINAWVSDETHQLIKTIVSPLDFDAYSAFVLTNTVYFKAKWENVFNEEYNYDGTFTKLDGTTVTVTMMNNGFYQVTYREEEDYKAAALPLKGDTVEMLVLLPNEGKFVEFEESLTPARLTQIVDGMEEENVIMRLPKLDYTPGQIDLKSILTAMGMADAFSGCDADFSGMDGRYSWLYLAFARHKACLKVDEWGIEAAAATATGGSIAALIPTFTVDRPYIVIIRDRVTGAILFMGRILDPTVVTD